MQEDSLRQSMNSPYLSRRKSFSENNPDGLDLDMYDPDCDPALSRSLNHSTGGLHSGIDNCNSSPLGSNRSSPAYFDSDLQVKRSNNSLASLSSHSNSPPSSPYSSQYLDQKTQAVLNDNHGHRRSMPNLSRGTPSGFQLPSHGSNSSLRERNTPSPSYHGQTPARTQTFRVSPNRQLDVRRMQGSDSPSRTLSPNRGTSPQRTYSPQRTISPQRTKMQKNISPGRTMSPQRSGPPPTARTGIPRPGTMSKLPMPRRSSIPSVRRSLATPRTNDESWKDGCY
ncbi:hypothetical protein LSH36_7g09018 [Paralvinella palmiformis]|uniref:Uncharacterized protein n=1 Tax=Paralvinella palmiformis TaxID=53620 RepID=A0AAD9NH11_9ANNE|nr:hypothetical protein LSH36_7g09018 [Paralvinella palmiformis]